MLVAIGLPDRAILCGLDDTRDPFESDDSAISWELFGLGVVAEVGDPAIPCELAVLEIVVEADEPAID